MRRLLHEAGPQPDGVAPGQAAQRHEGRPPEEDRPQLAVGHAESLQQADHARPLEHEDQQGRGHVEEGHDEHDDDDHRGIDVVGPQPVENVGIALRNARHGKVCRRGVVVVQERMAEPCGACVGIGGPLQEYFITRDLVAGPLGQPLHVAQVREDHPLVHVVHSRGVETGYLEAVATRQFAGLDEEHLHLVPGTEAQLRGEGLRQQDVLRTDRVAHTGKLPGNEPLVEKAPVVGRIDPLEHHPLDGILGADDASAQRIGRHRDEARHRADQLLEVPAPHHGPGIERLDTPDVGHRNMGRKSRHLVRHLALEPHDDGQRKDHHRNPQRHGDHGNTLHHAGLVLRRGSSHAAGDEKREIHGSCFYPKIYAK